MSSEQTTRDPAITEAMLPVIDRFIWTLQDTRIVNGSQYSEDLLNYETRELVAQCLAIAERERAEREVSFGDMSNL